MNDNLVKFEPIKKFYKFTYTCSNCWGVSHIEIPFGTLSSSGDMDCSHCGCLRSQVEQAEKEKALRLAGFSPVAGSHSGVIS